MQFRIFGDNYSRGYKVNEYFPRRQVNHIFPHSHTQITDFSAKPVPSSNHVVISMRDDVLSVAFAHVA